MQFRQRIDKISLEKIKGALVSYLGATDQHIIPTGAAMGGQNAARGLAKAAFGAIAGDGIADFFGAGETDADAKDGAASSGFIIAAFARLHHHRFGALAAGPGSGQKVGPFGHNR